MKHKLALVMGALVLSLISAAAGVAAGFVYMSRPFEKWQVQFSETYLPVQAEALKELRAGKTDRAMAYLEMASGFSLTTMGQQRAEGVKAPLSAATRQAITYLCETPPTGAAPPQSTKVSVGEACHLLLNQP